MMKSVSRLFQKDRPSISTKHISVVGRLAKIYYKGQVDNGPYLCFDVTGVKVLGVHVKQACFYHLNPLCISYNLV